MENETVKINRFILFINYVIAGIVLFNANTLWANDPDVTISSYLYYVLMACMFFLVDYFIKMSSGKINTNTLMAILGFTVYTIIFLIFNSFNKLEVIKIVAFIILSILLIDYELQINGRVPTVLVCYKNLMMVIAITSLFFWVFGSLLHIISASGVAKLTWNAGQNAYQFVPSYYGVYFETQSYDIVRNTLVFTEAPMASANLSFAFLIAIVEQSDIKKLITKQQLLFTITIISTLSTTGITVVIFTLLLKYVLANNGGSFARSFMILIVPIISILAIYVVYHLISQKAGTSSGSVRLDDYTVGFNAWKAAPIFGTGFENTDYIRSFMAPWRSNVGLGNSVSEILPNGGVYLFIGYLYAIIKGIYLSKVQRNNHLMILLIMLAYILAVTIIPYSYIVLLLLVWGCRTTVQNQNLSKKG